MLEEGSGFDDGDYESYYGEIVTVPAREWIVAQHIHQLWEIRAIDAVTSSAEMGVMAVNLNVVRTGWTLGTLAVTERTNYGQWQAGSVTVWITAEIQVGVAGYPVWGRAYRNGHTYYVSL